MQSHTPSAVRLVDNRRGRISLQYLEAGQQHRVRTSIRAIAARSLYQWDEVEPHQADVLVLEGEQADVRAAGPFKLWLGQPAPDVFGEDVFNLPRAFSTPMLWGVLDLIALRLMDSRRQPIEAGSTSFIQTDTATGIAPDTATTDKPAYRLLRPVTLDAHFSQPRFRVAMDGMTARPVSLDELVHHGPGQRLLRRRPFFAGDPKCRNHTLRNFTKRSKRGKTRPRMPPGSRPVLCRSYPFERVIFPVRRAA